MGKLLGGFILGFLSCVWTYGLDPTEAVFGFGGKLVAAHHQIERNYRVNPALGHKGQYSNYHRSIGVLPEPRPQSVANPTAYWLSQEGGPPVM